MAETPQALFTQSLLRWQAEQHADFLPDMRESLDATFTKYSSIADDPEAEIWTQTIKALSSVFIARLLPDLERVSNACQSPIERHLLFALLVAGFGSGFGVRGRERGRIWDWGYPLGGGPATLAIEPQAHIGDYQVDLMVELEDYGYGRWAKATLVVECDYIAPH